jgi:hypothetical protein
MWLDEFLTVRLNRDSDNRAGLDKFEKKLSLSDTFWLFCCAYNFFITQTIFSDSSLLESTLLSPTLFDKLSFSSCTETFINTVKALLMANYEKSTRPKSHHLSITTTTDPANLVHTKYWLGLSFYRLLNLPVKW